MRIPQQSNNAFEWMMLGLFFVNKPKTLVQYLLLWVGLVAFTLFFCLFNDGILALSYLILIGLPMTVAFYFHLINTYILVKGKEVKIMNVDLSYIHNPFKYYVRYILGLFIAMTLLKFAAPLTFSLSPVFFFFFFAGAGCYSVLTYVESKAISEAIKNNVHLNEISITNVYSEIRSVLVQRLIR